MKRLLLGCDPVGKSVLWEDGGLMSASGALPITISHELQDLLFDWNERMGVVVRTPERFNPTEILATKDALNEEGQRLAMQVEAEHAGQVRVRFVKE